MKDIGDGAATWREALASLRLSDDSAFGVDFFEAYGERRWQPNDADCNAAHALHVELISRIATQPLSYSEGVEERTLTSVFELFGRARTITEANRGCSTFEVLVWHVLNSSVRAFTAKWHPRSVAGALRALDNSDEFRAELKGVQAALIELDQMLQLLKADAGYIIKAPRVQRPNIQSINDEMARSVVWRPMGCRKPGDELSRFAEDERAAVVGRRSNYGLDTQQSWAAGLALSGGGIRSATFSLGVMVSLAKRNLLHQFDYLSTVSGGGYAGAFLTQLLGGEPQAPPGSRSIVGLRGTDLPFSREEGESEILRRIRQGASYLSGSFWERLGVAMAQAHGVFINLLVVALLAAGFAYADFALRLLIPSETAYWAALLSPLLLAAVFLVIPWVRRVRGSAEAPHFWMAALGVIFFLPIVWVALGAVHTAWQPLSGWVTGLYHAVADDASKPTVISALLTALASGSALAGALLAKIIKVRPVLLTFLTVALFVVLEVMAFNAYFALGPRLATAAFLGVIALFGYLWFALDINSTSLHGYYRAKLSAAFLIEKSLAAAKPIRLSEFNPELAPFPIINCALNLPGSNNPSMRGRLSDVFAITPVATGSPVLTYASTKEWEKLNPSLDLGTAMALSGAAVAPQMGLRTTRYASFWLTVLNLRLGAWLRNPATNSRAGHGPGISHLFRELTATADECGRFINLSDGGHIENLGVYELLRRRCRFIVAIDGENDPQMTFHALANLQRLAYIDHGIVLELDLDDLRLGHAGFSRSHFHFCRIIYPAGQQDAQEEIGYLAYLKLSLTGNEGEFLRRYKLDEPSFPHHSTADQFFSEPQFEAYRALGEHIGEKMFLPAITGTLGRNVKLEGWFQELGCSLLDVRAPATGSEPAAVP
ncbi:hypothetical protein [Sinorhizobium sp. 22678]|uniref:hypothetical protein n=1 Tax=Sinorhizobium sp. 22678 TaxID=3453955 RepID=UPI003F825777